MSSANKDCFFLIYLNKPKSEQNDELMFTSPKENLPKCIKTKEDNNYIIKVFKFNSKAIKDNKVIFEFSYDGKNYKVTLDNLKGKTFIFETILQQKKSMFGPEQKIEQTKIGFPEKMNYFIEALDIQKENNKLDILYTDSIKLCSKKPNFHFLINIFVRVYNTENCSNLLDVFNKNIDKPGQKDNIDKEKLLKYKFDFEQICENPEEIITKYSLNKIDFYALILCYLNNCRNDKYKELFESLFKKDKNILLDILLKYKLYFKKQIDLNENLLNEIIKYASTKDLKTFKENGLYYLKDTNTFLEILENNKNEIIKIKNFAHIDIPKIRDDEKIDFEKIKIKIEQIINFSKEKKILFIFLNGHFWESLSKKCSAITRENIELCSNLRKLFLKYNSMITGLFREDNDNPIRKEISAFFKRGMFMQKIDKIMKEYIKTNQKITNLEIIELIKNYNKYYTDERENYIKKREPDILSKIDLEEINEEFIQKFKEMKFEKIFKDDIDNYYSIFTNKIKNVNDINIILELININELGSGKENYLKQLKNKYNIAIKNSELSENDENIIKNLSSLTYFICENEGKIDFLKISISSSKIINDKIKHKIYIELINFCKGKKNDQIKNFIKSHYSGDLKQENLNEFIDFLENLEEDDANNFIQNIDNKYIIVENEFYSSGPNLNIELVNLIKQKLKLKDDNKFIISNIKTLEKIDKDIQNKEIKFEYLKNFKNDKKEIVLEKLNVLTLVPDFEDNPEDIYEKFIKYYDEMSDSLDNLMNYKVSLELYHQEIKKEEISKINTNIENIQKETYNNFHITMKKDIQNLIDESIDIVKKVNDVKDSKIFKIFFQKLSKNDKNDKTTFDKAYEEFEKFKQLLIEKGADIINKESNQNEIIKKIYDLYQEDKMIQNELSALISGEQKNEEEIIIILNSKNFEKDLKAMFYFFSYFNNNENVYMELNKWKEKCKNLSNNKGDNTEIKNILKELGEEGIYNYKENIENKSNYIYLFNLFYENGQALDFLNQHTTKDVDYLYDKIEPNRGSLKTNDISDISNCVGFFQELKGINGGLKEIIGQIKLKLNEQDSSILDNLKKYSEIYRAVIELYQDFDLSLNIYEKIKGIISDAKFIFNKNNDEFDLKDNQTISIDKIKELKNKIQLKQGEKKSLSDDEKSIKLKEKYEKLKFFKDLSNNIEEIHDLMDLLRTKGSTLPISIRVEVSYPEVKYFLGNNNKEIEFKEIKQFLSRAKTNILTKLESTYKQMTTIRFIYGKQIDSFLSHIQGNFPINSFLRYILNLTNSKTDVIEGEKSFNRKTQDYINEIEKYNSDSFDFIQEYIISLFKKNKSSIEQHYINISIKNDNDLKGLYTYFSEADSMEEDILQIFLDKVGKIPIAQNILISSKETSYEEMQAFFNRAILCKYNTLFVVEINGSLSAYQQRCMNIFIDKLLTHSNKMFNEKNGDKEVEKNDTHSYMKSCLVFIYNKKSESFINDLKNFTPKDLKMTKSKHSLNRAMTNATISSQSSRGSFDILREELYNKTHIIQSEVCGLGKSSKIKNKIAKLKKKYIYFPLGGNITKEIIYKRLNEKMEEINSKTTDNYGDIAIHLDIFDSKDNIVSVLNEFLFSFLITKFYSNNENFIYIPTNIEIFIEIPNCFKDFISNYGILKSFQKDDDMITIKNLPELNLPNKKIQLFKNMLGLCENHEIYNWLKNKIQLSRYSYHQIHIFINLFICQYNIFKGRKISFKDNGEDVTDKCINSFAEATTYFTYGGFSKLLLEKRDNIDNKMDDIDILSQEYDNNDLKNEKFKKKLIFIVENKDPNRGTNLGVYYNLDISDKALRNGEALGELSKEDKAKREQMKKEYSLEHFEKIEYLSILKTILDLKNPITPEELTPYDSISLIEILDKDEYIITKDNFRKMILILYRIIANIPVILMGETGCGKTALIKKLNQLLNNGEEKLEILNIDPSYNDKKLKKKMNDINQIALDYKKNGDELWVFFDELNTCDSLSLITEIFINRTYGGKELSENIRLIGACNPYRKKGENKNICGLTYHSGNEDEIQLVYLVNILPQSLMYYVFNFGSLEKKNEDQYISSIISNIFPDKKLREATKNVISNCHDYLRKTFDKSVVSLRELKRFKAMYRFLIKYFENKKKLNPEQSGTEESTKLKSIIIAIYLCYYIRLVDGKSRTNFDTELKKDFKNLVNYKFSKYNKSENFNENDVIYDGDLKNDLKDNYKITDFNNFNFSQILYSEEDFILSNIVLSKGIGKNKSLKENIFLLFTALVTNIPLIIIGKPGSSKSLSAQLIYKEMGGKYSRNEFFKLYPTIIQSYFQGSDSTTPEDVEGIFEIAKGRLDELKKNNNKENVDLPISMILFDELGLAERSKYNPLKVLHSHLELDGNKEGTSFVGISNWTLDAAKINRALTLSVPDLDSNFDDLRDTSISIAESINDTYGNRTIFKKILPNAYLYFKENLNRLRKLTAYKQFELQEYKLVVEKYKRDEDFEKIYNGIDESKSFFKSLKENSKEGQKEKEEDIKKIFEYNVFKSVEKKLKQFLKEKNDLKNPLLDQNPFKNKNFEKILENEEKINENFLGNRDFYFLIKGIAYEMNELNIVDLKGIIKKYIERNFGGFEVTVDFEKDYDLQELETEIKDFHKKFLEKISEREKWSSVQLFEIVYDIYCLTNDEPDSILGDAILDDFNYIQNITDNIRDIKSRYLLLGISPSRASLIHQKISKELKKTIYFYEGSPFENDNNNEYQFKIINKIQEHAESGDTVILHNLNQVYAFLYDLFNKNFIIKDGKQYARICQGNYSDQLTPINREFRVIIMVNKKYLNKVEPPFLNRFEKMKLSFDKLTNKKQKKLAEIIVDEFDVKKYENKLNYEINYKLGDLLIGCNTQDVLGMIYYELDSDEKEKDDNKIKENIFNKIYKLLPQDIIVNINDENNILKKIYNEKKQYYNLEQYIKSNPKHKISIIYTFSSIKAPVKVIDESSSFKMISEIKSETQLLSSINSIISEKNSNKYKNKGKNNDFIYIHFDDSNSKKIGFLISFVINNYYKNENIKFIFIIYIKRNFRINQEKEKIFAVPDINSDIYQLFIDNLNGKEIKLNEIISDPIQKLLEEDLIIIGEKFHNALNEFTYDNLQKLYGDNDIITENNYLAKLENDDSFKVIKEIIIEKIKEIINGENGNSISIIEKIYKAQYINADTIDIITVIKDYVEKEIIFKYIYLILCKLEDNNILTSLLVLNSYTKLAKNDELKETIIKMIKQYINTIKIDYKYEPKFILNYVIPCYYKTYIKLSEYITQNIHNDFFKNEKTIRNFSNDKKNKNDVLDRYYKKEEYLLSLTYNEIQNDKLFFEYVYKIPNYLILNDYITYFIIKYRSNNEGLNNQFYYESVSYNDSKHKLINLIINIRFDDTKKIVENNNNDPLKLLLMKINWMEANKIYITKILDIYDILEMVFEEKDYIKIFEETLREQKLRYITHEKKNPDITTEVNECFYKILASFCYSVIPPYIDFNEKIDTFIYIDSLKNAMKIILGLNDDLNIYSIEVNLIDELIHIYDVLSLNDKLNGSELNNICMALKQNNLILQVNKEIPTEELIDSFKNLISALNEVLKYTDKNYFSLLQYIFYKETKKVPNVIYRTAIFQEVIKDPEVLLKSNNILQILLFPLIKPRKETFSKSLDLILDSTDYDIAVIIENILENKNENEKMYNSLSETLLYYFEKNSFMYFHDIFYEKEKFLLDNDDNEDKEAKKSMGPLKLFNNCVKILNDYYKGKNQLNDKNKNMCKLFCLGYIRAYCYMFTKLIYPGSSNLGNSSKIIKEINNSKALTNIISLYIWKTIYNKHKKNIDIFLDPTYITNYKLKEYKSFQNIEINENPFSYDLVIHPQNKDVFEKFIQTMEKYNENKFEEVNLNEFKINEIGIDIFYFSSTIFILSRLKQKQFINENLIYKNFFKNVCTPLFKNKEKIFNAIKLLFNPEKYQKLENELNISPDNLNIILHSYRYFINEIYSNSQNNIYSPIYGRHIDIKKLNNNFYPGNDIKNKRIHLIYSKIVNHFETTPDKGCFVCLCEEGGCYRCVEGGIPNKKYLDLVCDKCRQKIGAQLNNRGFVEPIKRDNYYRIFSTREELENDTYKNGEKYNRMSLDEFIKKYIIKEFNEEKGIQKNDESFFKKDTKIIRSLSQITFRILNFILYSHLLFSRFYNEANSLNKCLPDNMSWIQVISDCWTMIKNELNKLGINAIDIFMNYIFSDLFSLLNKRKSLNSYFELDELEKIIDKKIQEKIISFKENYKKFYKSKNNKFSFQNIIEERYLALDENEYPFYEYFYYSDYIDEAFVLNKLNYIENEKYPVLLRVLKNNLNRNQNMYSLDKLPNFNEVLNLFNEKYSYSIKRNKANTLQLKDLKDEEFYINNRDAIKEFMEFYNNLPDREVKSEEMKLSNESKLSDFFILDDNEFGKSYKKIYNKFIQEQNKEISGLLDIKKEKGIFEESCKNKINIQSADSNEIFITNLPDKFSFAEVAFDSSYRIIALDKNYVTYNHIKVDFNLIEETMTELLLRNKKLFNDSIINFVYCNENLEFENKNIITEFNHLYDPKDIAILDKKILYCFYEKNKTKNDDFFISILNNFIKLIISLNANKKLLNENKKNAKIIKDDTRIIDVLEKDNKASTDFKEIFEKQDSLIISKTANLLGYYRDLIFRRIKIKLKPFQYELEDEQKKLINKCFGEKNIIKEKIFKLAIRTFTVFFLNFEKDKENNIKENNNNIVNYLDIPDLWDKAISGKGDFHKELNDLKDLNIKLNQVIYLYDFLGEDIDEKFFEDVVKLLKKEEEIKKIEEKEEPIKEDDVKPPEEEDDDDSYDYNAHKSEDEDDDGNDDDKYI